MCTSCHAVGVCALAVDPGPCSVPVIRWYYSHDTGRCVAFTFGGCHGNANKFDTRQECEGVCPVQGLPANSTSESELDSAESVKPGAGI